jgi:hypothetical protein
MRLREEESAKENMLVEKKMRVFLGDFGTLSDGVLSGFDRR